MAAKSSGLRVNTGKFLATAVAAMSASYARTLGLRPEARSCAATRPKARAGSQIGDRLSDRIVITTGKDAYRRPDGVAVVPLSLLGPLSQQNRIVTELADAVLSRIRTRVDLYRWSAANDHGAQMLEAVTNLEEAAETDDPATVFIVTQAAWRRRSK